jgi:Ca2+-binding EF-hand superfamily protein
LILKDLTQEPHKDKNAESDRLGAAGGHKDTGKQAEIAFRLYDKDKDGYITKVVIY